MIGWLVFHGNFMGNIWELHGDVWKIYGNCMVIYGTYVGNIWEKYGKCMGNGKIVWNYADLMVIYGKYMGTACSHRQNGGIYVKTLVFDDWMIGLEKKWVNIHW